MVEHPCHPKGVHQGSGGQRPSNALAYQAVHWGLNVVVFVRSFVPPIHLDPFAVDLLCGFRLLLYRCHMSTLRYV